MTYLERACARLGCKRPAGVDPRRGRRGARDRPWLPRGRCAGGARVQPHARPRRCARSALRPARQSLRLARARARVRARPRVLVNTTTLGMNGVGGLDIDFHTASIRRCVVCDIVYVPLETELIVRAPARGLRTVDGLGMLLHQAVPGFEKWFGVRPEVTRELRDLARRRHRGKHMLIARPHRLARHGQVHRRGASARARPAGVRRRRRGAPALCRDRRAADRSGVSGHDARGQGRPQCAVGRAARGTRGASPSSRKSCIR